MHVHCIQCSTDCIAMYSTGYIDFDARSLLLIIDLAKGGRTA